MSNADDTIAAERVAIARPIASATPMRNDWMTMTAKQNSLYYGDNLAVLRESIPTESVDLIYLDPPFNSNASYNVLSVERRSSDSCRAPGKPVGAISSACPVVMVSLRAAG